MEPDTPIPSDVVRAAIIRSKLSLGELSRRSGVDTSSLSRFVARRNLLGLAAVDKLAPVLGLKISRNRSPRPL